MEAKKRVEGVDKCQNALGFPRALRQKDAAMSRRPVPVMARIGLALALVSAGGIVYAQMDGDRAASPAPVDAASSFEVDGITVDVTADNAEAARHAGWRLAQRRGWAMLSQRLGGRRANLSDSALNGIVTGIVIEDEQIGPKRYIARLGVLFDRGRTGAILGVSTALRRSVPMLVVPVEWSGGTGRVFERETAWSDAWGRFRAGSSTIDYVRVRGTGADRMLLNAGQTTRRGRGWWRTILGSYGASDVLIPEVELRRSYPGGPVIGVFTASHGPDHRFITRFALRVDSEDALDALLDAGVRRIDRAYQDAMARGALNTDRLLGVRPPSATEAVAEEEVVEDAPGTATPTPGAAEVASFTVQVDTPDSAALTASESAIRGVPGVRSANTTSLALGGISVMRVSYGGSIGSLRAALEARGWNVQEGGGVLRIRRAGRGSPTPAGGNGGE